MRTEPEPEWQSVCPVRPRDFGGVERPPRPGSRFDQLRALASHGRQLAAATEAFVRVPLRVRRMGPRIPPGPLAERFFGINIAPGPTPAHDEYVRAQVRRLGVGAVRIGFGYEAGDGAVALIRRLAQDGVEVLVTLVPPREEAVRLRRRDVGQRWAEFVESALSRLGDHVTGVEIGSTVNRIRWSGFSPGTYVRAVELALPAIRRRGLPWLGPNTTDFEPPLTVFFLAALRRAGLRPAWMTNNLFVDRALEPESYDSAATRPLPAEWVGLDTLGKARVLSAIAREHGLPARFVNTYATWDLNITALPRRRFVDPQQYARYLVRYATMCAASGTQQRMYWGTMISYQKGLIDDGTGYQPKVPQVQHYGLLKGDVADYCERPAFAAYRALVGRLEGGRVIGRVPSCEGTTLIELARPDGTTQAVGWTRDGLYDPLGPYLASRSALRGAWDVYGRPIALADGLPPMTESPIVLELAAGGLRPASAAHRRTALTDLAVPQGQGVGHVRLATGGRVGAARADVAHALGEALADPEALFERPGAVHIKQGRRSRLSLVPLPELGPEAAAILKRFPTRRMRRDGRSRAVRTWNNACQILTRGSPTAAPLAVLEAPRRPWRAPSYWLSERVRGVTVRQLLGDDPAAWDRFAGIDRETLLGTLARFIRQLHRARIWHRDLTAGNILIDRRANEDGRGELAFAVIDVSRARFTHDMTESMRSRDLACLRRLDDAEHRRIVEIYCRHRAGHTRNVLRWLRWRDTAWRWGRAIKQRVRFWRRKKQTDDGVDHGHKTLE